MTLTIPDTIDAINPSDWHSYKPFFEELENRELNQDTILTWLSDWSQLLALVHEAGAMIYIRKSMDTTDTERETAFMEFISNVEPNVQNANQRLRQRLLTANLDAYLPEDLTLVLRNMRSEVALFREENVPLQVEVAKLGNDYDKITGGLTAVWEGEEKNLSQLSGLLLDKNRSVREKAWLTAMDLWQGVRGELNALFAQMLELRQQIAHNAGLSDYRAYAFQEYHRFDYTPEDCLIFHDAIEKVVVPAAQRIYEKKRQQLGVEKLRPWDTRVDASEHPALRPYSGQAQLIQGCLNIFNQVDPVLGRYLATMAEEELLDLDTRPGKALGGYCSTLPLRKRPFIFMNGIGTHDDVQTMLHESGHAFHAFEAAALPFIWQENAPMEFCEVASMSMELLAAPYLTNQHGGFYTQTEAAQAQKEHLEGLITFLPYMAVVDAFQHWVYTHPQAAANPNECDKTWDTLWQKFMPGIDFTGYEPIRESGWHRKLHIFQVPFYYIEYGIAQIGAMQIWRNSLKDQQAATQAYRRALALGGTKTLPELFKAADIEFRFDAELVTELVALVEDKIAQLEARLR